ncbi:GIY-YIG nuclease family protein [Mycobacterium sp. E1715]|uniref:GIY-YIG nuclease family protein n=1 Tax=Mycobacterium sp. E1715 TaxID=1856863 RepID=UPI0018D2F307|nr:GIY-YIG nuclease family protein [Mycobacterium sp. E1715]
MYATLDVLLRAEWHRAGVYCFWDPDTGDALYIGVTNDLAERFAQHNSLKGYRPNSGNKGRQVNEWFTTHSRLGFSVVLQDAYADETDEPYSRNAEGQLLEGYRQVHLSLPPWNNMGGSRMGASYVRQNSAAWVDYMTGKLDSLVVARSTIRGLNDDASAEYNEIQIHLARTALLHGNSAFDDAKLLEGLERLIERMRHYSEWWRENGDRLRDHLKRPAPHPERI